MPSSYQNLGESKGGDPNILKLEATNKVRPLDNMVAEWRQHAVEDPNDSNQVTMLVCPGPRSCPLCRKPTAPDGTNYFPMSRRFAACVWDYNTNTVKVLVAGPQVFDEFKSSAKLGIEPSSCDWTITKEGKELTTKYSVVRHNAEPGPVVAPDQLLDIAKYEAPASVEKMFETLEKYGIDFDALPVPSYTLDEALAFVMPYTTHKGETVEHLIDTDQSFAEWLHGQKLEQGQLGDPVFLALQTALEAASVVPPLEDALAAMPEPEVAPPPAPKTAASTPATADGVPEPADNEVRLITPNGIPANVPKSSEASLLAAGFTKPEPPAAEPEPEHPTTLVVEMGGQKVELPYDAAQALLASGQAQAVDAGLPFQFPDADSTVEIQIGGSTVSMIFSQAEPLVESGTAEFVDQALQSAWQNSKDESAPPEEPAPKLKLPAPDDVVDLNISGTVVPMAFSQARGLVEGGSAEFVDENVQAALDQNQDEADRESVQEQAATEQASPVNQPPEPTDDLPNKCPHCGKGYKSKGGLTQHINRDHAGAPTPAQSNTPPQAPEAAPAAAANGNGGGQGSLVDQVKDKIAKAPFSRDYNKLLEIFKEETGKGNIMDMTDTELTKLGDRIDKEIAAA